MNRFLAVIFIIFCLYSDFVYAEVGWKDACDTDSFSGNSSWCSARQVYKLRQQQIEIALCAYDNSSLNASYKCLLKIKQTVKGMEVAYNPTCELKYEEEGNNVDN